MVFYFTLSSAPQLTCYMGRDKYENEDLIKWGWDEDIWFHVDDLSSAHVYVRLTGDLTIDSLSPETLEELAQLTKQNSIEGCKKNDVQIIYTPWKNLHKRADMDIGTIGYHNPKEVRRIRVESKKPEIIKRLEKTRREVTNIDFQKMRQERDAQEREHRRKEQQQQKEAAKRALEEEKKKQEMKSYTSLMKKIDARDAQPIDEDDFM